MKVEFLKVVRDKNTGKEYGVGEIVEFDKKRGAEILNAKDAAGKPYAQLVEEVKEEIKLEETTVESVEGQEETQEEKVEEIKPKKSTKKKPTKKTE